MASSYSSFIYLNVQRIFMFPQFLLVFLVLFYFYIFHVFLFDEFFKYFFLISFF